MRRRKLFAVAAALCGAALLAQTGAFGAPAHTSGATGVTVSASTGSSAVVNLGAAGWKVLTSATATQSGAQISTPGFSTGGWVTPAHHGAGAPGTGGNALFPKRGCPNVFFSTHM